MKKERKKGSIVVVERFFNVRYIFFFAFMLSFGVLFGFFRLCLEASFLWLLFFVPILPIPFVFSTDRKRTLMATLAFALAFICGFLVFYEKVDEYQSAEKFSGEHNVVGTVCEKVQAESYTRVLLSDIYIAEKPSDFKLVAYLSPSFSENIRVSDRVVLRGKVYTYQELMQNDSFIGQKIADGVKYYCFCYERVQAVGQADDLFLTVRARIEEVVRAGMDEASASLTLALLLGDTAGIEEGLLENIRAGGIAHIFAVSGLHIAALYAFCRLLTEKTRFSRAPAWTKFLFVSLIVLFYGGVCGFSSSVVRAIVMCLTAYFCRLVFINYDMLEGLGLAGAIVLLLFPTLLFDVGFQLTFTACIGIGLLSGVIRRGMGGDGVWLNHLLIGKDELARRATLHKKRVPLGLTAQAWKWFAGVFSLSLAAQMGTFPVLINAFGFVSGWGLLLNILFVPLVSASFSLLLLLVALSAILPISLSGVILFFPSLLWSVLSLLFEAVDFSGFALTGSLPFGAVWAFYLFLVLSSDKLNLKKAKLPLIAVALALFFFTWLAPYFV